MVESEERRGGLGGLEEGRGGREGGREWEWEGGRMGGHKERRQREGRVRERERRWEGGRKRRVKYIHTYMYSRSETLCWLVFIPRYVLISSRDQ